MDSADGCVCNGEHDEECAYYGERYPCGYDGWVVIAQAVDSRYPEYAYDACVLAASDDIAAWGLIGHDPCAPVPGSGVWRFDGRVVDNGGPNYEWIGVWTMLVDLAGVGHVGACEERQ